MGKPADKNGPAKAFSQLEITSYRDLINHETWLSTSHWWCYIWGLKSWLPYLKLTKLKIWCLGWNHKILCLPNFPAIQCMVDVCHQWLLSSLNPT